MAEWSQFFKGKRITLMGLGLLGRGAGDARFLAENGAELTVTDLKDEAALAPSLRALKGFPNISYRLGGHDLADFRGRDFVLKAAGIRPDSPYLEEAAKNGIPIKMSASWFAELAKGPVIGVTGTRGKSTTTHLLYDIVHASGAHALLGGNVRGVSTLALLSEVTPESVAVMELDSWQCRGFGDSSMSPAIAVFTTFYPDHLNYYRNDLESYLADKAHIFLHQEPSDTLIVSTQAAPLLKEKYGREIRSKVVIADPARFPKGWKLKIPGEHNVLNTMCAIEAARAFGVDDEVIRTAVEAFAGVPGRLEYIREARGVRIYNDNNATTPEATIAALRAVGTPNERSVVLVMGGDEKNLDMSALIAEIPRWCSGVVLFKERGTDRIREQIFALEKEGVRVFEEEGLEATIKRAFSIAEPGSVLLYSPAFSSFGKYFANEFDRSDQFRALAEKLA